MSGFDPFCWGQSATTALGLKFPPQIWMLRIDYWLHSFGWSSTPHFLQIIQKNPPKSSKSKFLLKHLYKLSVYVSVFGGCLYIFVSFCIYITKWAMFQPLRHPFCRPFILVSQERVFEFMDHDSLWSYPIYIYIYIYMFFSGQFFAPCNTLLFVLLSPPGSTGQCSKRRYGIQGSSQNSQSHAKRIQPTSSGNGGDVDCQGKRENSMVLTCFDHFQLEKNMFLLNGPIFFIFWMNIFWSSCLAPLMLFIGRQNNFVRLLWAWIGRLVRRNQTIFGGQNIVSAHTHIYIYTHIWPKWWSKQNYIWWSNYI